MGRPDVDIVLDRRDCGRKKIRRLQRIVRNPQEHDLIFKVVQIDRSAVDDFHAPARRGAAR